MASPSRLLAVLLTFAMPTSAARHAHHAYPIRDSPPTNAWPHGPLLTRGPRITDARAQNVTYAGVNWPGAANVMIPEGLQYQSVASIVGRIKDLGMNAVRLTWATQMVDQVFDNGGNDVTVRDAFVAALGTDKGPVVYAQVLAKNPDFNDKTTRLQVFAAVAAECAKQEIYVHLDNHISAGGWCCSTEDGNSWWGDDKFSVGNWTRGLTFMAEFGKNWTGLTSMSLRNELRRPSNNATAAATYDWAHWYENVKQGAAAIRTANQNVLVFLSGLDFDTKLSPVVRGDALDPGTTRFNRLDFPGLEDMLVLELHNYATDTKDCNALQGSLDTAGFEALNATSATNVFPVVLSEWGLKQDSAAATNQYATCLASYLPSRKAGWMIWGMPGSYYTREGKQDADEEWGMLNHDWSSWRNPDFVEKVLKPMAKSTVTA